MLGKVPFDVLLAMFFMAAMGAGTLGWLMSRSEGNTIRSWKFAIVGLAGFSGLTLEITTLVAFTPLRPMEQIVDHMPPDCSEVVSCMKT